MKEGRRPAVAWWLLALLAALIALYALAFGVVGEPMFQGELAPSFRERAWAIRSHAVLGSVALLLGALQLRRDLLVRRRPLHVRLGQIYVAATLITGATGLYVAAHAYGGWITRTGFGLLAVALLFCTLRAYAAIRARQVARHREWMILSYALILAAVALRIELPLLAAAFGGFLPGYRIVAWLCWVPNLLVAGLYLRGSRAVQGPLVAGLYPPRQPAE